MNMNGRALSSIFNDFVQEAEGSFPALRGRFLIVDVPRNTVYGVHRLEDGKTGVERTGLPAYLGANSTMARLRRADTASTVAFQDPRGLNIIFFNEKMAPELADSVSEAAEERLVRMMRHELGHLGIPGGYYDAEETPQQVLGECIADAYALLRHYQLHGTEKLPADKYVSAFARASSLVMYGDTSHYTLPVLEAINNCRNAIDYAAQDEERMADLAFNLAFRHVPSMGLLAGLKETFMPVRGLWGHDKTAAVKKLAEITLDAKASPEVFQAGAAWLRPFAAGTLSFKGEIPEFAKAERAELAQELERRRHHFDRLRKTDAPRARPAEWRKLGLMG